MGWFVQLHSDNFCRVSRGAPLRFEVTSISTGSASYYGNGGLTRRVDTGHGCGCVEPHGSTDQQWQWGWTRDSLSKGYLGGAVIDEEGTLRGLMAVAFKPARIVPADAFAHPIRMVIDRIARGRCSPVHWGMVPATFAVATVSQLTGVAALPPGEGRRFDRLRPIGQGMLQVKDTHKQHSHRLLEHRLNSLRMILLAHAAAHGVNADTIQRAREGSAKDAEKVRAVDEEVTLMYKFQMKQLQVLQKADAKGMVSPEELLQKGFDGLSKEQKEWAIADSLTIPALRPLNPVRPGDILLDIVPFMSQATFLLQAQAGEWMHAVDNVKGWVEPKEDLPQWEGPIMSPSSAMARSRMDFMLGRSPLYPA